MGTSLRSDTVSFNRGRATSPDSNGYRLQSILWTDSGKIRSCICQTHHTVNESNSRGQVQVSCKHALSDTLHNETAQTQTVLHLVAYSGNMHGCAVKYTYTAQPNSERKQTAFHLVDNPVACTTMQLHIVHSQTGTETCTSDKTTNCRCYKDLKQSPVTTNMLSCISLLSGNYFQPSISRLSTLSLIHH